MERLFLMFLDHTQWRTTVGRTPLDEWSARRRDLRPLACWDHGFESHRGHGYLSVVSVVCCQVEVSATSWSLVQRSPTDCCVVVCDLETSRMGAPYIYDISRLRVNIVNRRLLCMYLCIWNRYRFVVSFLLGNSPASELYMPTFRNTLSVPSS